MYTQVTYTLKQNVPMVQICPVVIYFYFVPIRKMFFIMLCDIVEKYRQKQIEFVNFLMQKCVGEFEVISKIVQKSPV